MLGQDVEVVRLPVERGDVGGERVGAVLPLRRLELEEAHVVVEGADAERAQPAREARIDHLALALRQADAGEGVDALADHPEVLRAERELAPRAPRPRRRAAGSARVGASAVTGRSGRSRGARPDDVAHVEDERHPAVAEDRGAGEPAHRVQVGVERLHHQLLLADEGVHEERRAAVVDLDHEAERLGRGRPGRGQLDHVLEPDDRQVLAAHRHERGLVHDHPDVGGGRA